MFEKSSTNPLAGGITEAAVALTIIGALLIYWYDVGDLDFSPRDVSSPTTHQIAGTSLGTARPDAPDLELPPETFRSQTYSALVIKLRSDGHPVRCYEHLKGKEKLYPSISRICVVSAKTAWGIPVQDVSFHFGGEELQFVRIEFTPDQWPQVKRWFAALPGEDAGIFGKDPQGNEIAGRSLGDGLIMTAPPSRGDTVLAIWESHVLFIDRCLSKSQLFTERQKSILCWR